MSKKLITWLSMLLITCTMSLYGQNAGKRISVKAENQALESVLKQIDKSSGVKILFTYEDVQGYNVSLSVTNAYALEAVKQAIANCPLSITTKDQGKFITVSRRREGAPQAMHVEGVVVDDAGQPLPGVNISLNGRGVAATDANGKFTVQSGLNGYSLTFSFVGFESKTVSYKNSTEGERIVLNEQTNAISDVVVNGFFTRQKNSFSGAVQSISGQDLVTVSPTNVMAALATLDAGITISDNNLAGSNPNAVPDLVIRSTTSLATDDEVGLNAPLIVIDGVESNLQALYDMDIHDIERIDILKDASATALYGENAANGVIVVERKRVSQSPVRIRYTFTPEFEFADLSSYDLCNAAQKLELERRAGLYESNTGSLDQTYFDRLALVSSGLDTDWISKPVRNSFSHNHSISITGRGSGLDYNITGNFSQTHGVMKGDARNRSGLNLYLSYRPIEKLVLTLRASHNEVSTHNSPYGSFSDYTLANPYDSPYDEKGNLRTALSYNYNNPLYEASLKSFSKANTRTQSISIDGRYNFRPAFYVTSQISYTTARGTQDTFVSPKSNVYASTTNLDMKGRYTVGNTSSDAISAKLVANYIKSLDDMGTQLTLNLGGEIKKSDDISRSLSATGFLSDELCDIAYASSYPTGGPSGSEALATSVGAFLSANFVIRNRYFIDGSYRVSGSSKFGSNHRYAPFWSAGIGYNLHNEKFIKELGWVDMLRLRASYGFTGSVKFNAYQAETIYQYASTFLHYTGVGAVPIAMANPDLKWQITKKFNVGLSSSFLKERFNLNIDYYNEKTADMLIDMTLPPSAGATSVKANLGSQRANGVEFSTWGKIIQNRDWQWNLTWNGLHQKTTIEHISDALKRLNEQHAADGSSASPRIQYREGESPTAIYAVRSAGIDPASGKEIFIKKDGSYTYTYSADDQVSCGDTNPALQGTISSYLRWKNLSVNAAFSYRFGSDIYNSTRVAKIENIDPRRNADVRAFEQRWSKPGDLVPYLNISTTGGTSYVFSDRFVEKNNELWFSSMTITYNFPDEWLNKIKNVQKLYVSVGTEDLFRLTTVKYERGTSYPYSRSINMSISATF